MPSKSQYELNKLKGNLTKEDEIIGNTLASINNRINNFTKQLLALETRQTTLINQKATITKGDIAFIRNNMNKVMTDISSLEITQNQLVSNNNEIYSSDIVNGINGVSSGTWDTFLSNISNFTDGNENTETGEGADAPAGAYILWTLPYYYDIKNIRTKFWINPDSGCSTGVRTTWYISYDNSNWTQIYQISTTTTQTFDNTVNNIFEPAKYIKMEIDYENVCNCLGIKGYLLNVNGRKILNTI